MSMHAVAILVCVVVYLASLAGLYFRVQKKCKRLRNFFVKQPPVKSNAAPPPEFSWLVPFSSAISHSALIPDVRDHTQKQAEENIYSIWEFEAMQRLAIVAPLLGVVLTASGFAVLSPDTDNIGSLTLPLAAGVLTGAGLAIANQFSLFLVEQSLNRARIVVRDYIDLAWANGARELGDPQEALLHVAERFNATVDKLASLVGQFPTNVDDLQKRFKAISAMADSTFREVSQMPPLLNEVVETWTSCGRNLTNAIGPSFIESLSRLTGGSDAISEAAQKLEPLMIRLGELLEQLSLYQEEQARSTQTFVALAEDTADWTQDSVKKFATQVQVNADALFKPISAAATALADLPSLLTNTARIAEALGRTASGVDSFVETKLEPANQSITNMAGFAEKLQQCAVELNSRLVALSSFSEQCERSNAILFKLIDTRALPTAEVLQRATGVFEDSSHRIADCCEELEAAVQVISKSLPSEPSLSPELQRE